MKIWVDFINKSIKYMQLNPERIKICLDKLTEDQVWEKPVSEANSIGNLILHLEGNITQYIISGLGNKPDERERDLEFSSYKTHNKEELLKIITSCIDEACATLKSLNPEQLQKDYDLQGFHLTGTDVIIHVTEHLSYHTGQIALITKLMTNQDLKFYKDRDLNVKNK